VPNLAVLRRPLQNVIIDPVEGVKMQRNCIRSLVVILLGTFCSIGFAMDREDDLEAYHQRNSSVQDYLVKDNGGADLQSYPDDSKATEDSELSPIVIDAVKAHLLFDPSPIILLDSTEVVNSLANVKPGEELIRVNIFPVIPRQTKSKQFVLAMPGSAKQKNNPVPSDGYALSRDLYTVKLSSVSGLIHLKTMNGADVGSGKELTFKRTKKGLDYELDGKRNPFDGLAIISDVDQLTRVEWPSILGLRSFNYFGNFIIYKETAPSKEDAVKIINFVNIEKYVREVVPGEMDAKFPLPALEAQAIAARTYAYNKINQWRNHRNFDVSASTQDQLYIGASREDKTAYAVTPTENTRGQILVYKGQVCKSLFSENNAGRTVAHKDYDPQHIDYPYLIARDDPGKDVLYKMHSGTYRLDVDAVSLAMAVRKLGFNFPDNEVLGLIPGEFAEPSKILKSVIILGRSGSVTIQGKKFAELVQTAGLRFYMEPGKRSGKSVSMVAHRSGSGVGLCQEGAQILANKFHYSSKKILDFYYPHAQITTYDPSYSPTIEPTPDASVEPTAL
jgi:SpoIID/LytB domain protein